MCQRSDFEGIAPLRASMSRAVGRAPELLAERAQAAQQLLPRRKPPRNEPRLPLGRVPAAEVLDHRLRMHGRLRVCRELPHRRRTPKPLGTRRQLVRGSPRPCSACGYPPGMRQAPPDRYLPPQGGGATVPCKQCRAISSSLQERPNGRVPAAAGQAAAADLESLEPRAASGAATLRRATSSGRIRSSAATQRGQNWVPAARRSSASASSSGRAAR